MTIVNLTTCAAAELHVDQISITIKLLPHIHLATARTKYKL